MESSMGALFVLGLSGVGVIVIWAVIAVATTRGKPRVSQSREIGAKATGSLAAGMLMLSVFLPWGSSSTLRITANYVTFVLGALLAVSVGIAGVGRSRSRALVAAAGVATALVASVDVVARMKNVGEVHDLGASVGIGLWLAVVGGIAGIASGVLWVISASLPSVARRGLSPVQPPAPPVTAQLGPFAPAVPTVPEGGSHGISTGPGGGVILLAPSAPPLTTTVAPPAPPPVRRLGMPVGTRLMIALAVTFLIIGIAAFAVSFMANKGNAKTFADQYAALNGADPAVEASSLETGTHGFVSALTAYRTATKEAVRLQGRVTDMFDRAVARYEAGNTSEAKELVSGKGSRLIDEFREAVREQRAAGDAVATAYQDLQEVLP